jgi:hypothetical protein
VAAMGLALDPENPLYASGAAQAAALNSSFGRASAATSVAAASAAAVLARPPLYADDADAPAGECPGDLPDDGHDARQDEGLHGRLHARPDPALEPGPAHRADSRPEPVPEPQRFQAVDDVPDLDFKLDFDAPAQPARAGVDGEIDASPSFVQSGVRVPERDAQRRPAVTRPRPAAATAGRAQPSTGRVDG